LNRERAASYKELNQRVQRSRELRRIAQKMQTQKNLMVKAKATVLLVIARDIPATVGRHYLKEAPG